VGMVVLVPELVTRVRRTCKHIPMTTRATRIRWDRAALVATGLLAVVLLLVLVASLTTMAP